MTSLQLFETARMPQDIDEDKTTVHSNGGLNGSPPGPGGLAQAFEGDETLGQENIFLFVPNLIGTHTAGYRSLQHADAVQAISASSSA